MLRGLATAAAILVMGAPVASAAEPILPLAQVRSGADCTALSVIQGTLPSRFDARVLDVVGGDPAFPGPMIVVRVSGAAVDASGVGPGFSGSPVYCPGADGVPRVIGAISQTLGDYGNKTVLVTPIEQMLGERPEVPAGVRSAPRAIRSARPLAGALTIAGASGPVRASLLQAARRTGRVVLAAPSAAPAAAGPTTLEPGASVSAGLASGEISIGSVGTVTYRDGSAIWAFGHPLDGAGRRSLPLQEAYVFGVISNPLGIPDAITYKLAAPGRPVGTLTNDALSAIVGRVGAPPRTIALRVAARDLDTGRSAALTSAVSDERDLDLGSALQLTSSLALSQALARALRSTPPRVSGSMCVRIALAGRQRPLGFCEDVVDGARPFDDLSSAMGLVDGFEFGRITPRSVRVRITLRRGVRESFMVGAAAPRIARAGQRIRIRLALQRRRGGRSRTSFVLRVPRSLRPGLRVLTLRGTVPRGPLDALQAALEQALGVSTLGGGPPPQSVGALASAVAALGGSQGVRASFSARRRGPVVLRTPGALIRGKLALLVRIARPRAPANRSR